MSQPKIVISVNAAWNLVNFRRSLMTGLVAAGYRVIAVAPPDGRELELAELGVEFVPIHIDGRGMSPLADARLILSYIRVLQRLRPAAYLGFTIKPNVYGGMACRYLGIPHIANIAGLGTAFMRRGALNLLVRRLYATGLKNTARVFFQNREDCAHFVSEGLVDRQAVALLPGSGVDLSRFVPSNPPPGAPTTFLLVTRLLRAKGVAEFVEAAASLQSRYGQAVRFRILGIRDRSAGGIEDATLEQWQRDGHVELLDAVSDVRPVVAEADCAVLPSYYPEGTPRSLLEAAAMGKAIVTTDTPGCRDVVDEGVNGFLCSPRDPVALAATMERYHQLDADARDAMGRASRAKAEREFDEKLVINAYLSVLKPLAVDQH